MVSETQVQTLIEEHISETDKFLVSLSISETGHIHVVIDGDLGVTIADCIALSRHIEHNIDRETFDFSLEVSTYGVGNPLLMPRQYHKNIGRLLEVHLQDELVHMGRIITADQEGISLDIQPIKKKGVQIKAETGIVGFKYAEIKKALIQVEF